MFSERLVILGAPDGVSNAWKTMSLVAEFKREKNATLVVRIFPYHVGALVEVEENVVVVVVVVVPVVVVVVEVVGVVVVEVVVMTVVVVVVVMGVLIDMR
jgi:hypothetical protein